MRAVDGRCTAAGQPPESHSAPAAALHRETSLLHHPNYSTLLATQTDAPDQEIQHAPTIPHIRQTH